MLCCLATSCHTEPMPKSVSLLDTLQWIYSFLITEKFWSPSYIRTPKTTFHTVFIFSIYTVNTWIQCPLIPDALTARQGHGLWHAVVWLSVGCTPEYPTFFWCSQLNRTYKVHSQAALQTSQSPSTKRQMRIDVELLSQMAPLSHDNSH